MGTRRVEIKRSLLENVENIRLSYFWHIMRKCGSLEKEITLETSLRERRRGKSDITAWTQSI